MSRKYARENAFKVVFTDIKEENSLNWEELASEEKDGEIWSGKAPSEEDGKYIENVCTGVKEHAAQIDETIGKYLRGWTIDRINRVCLAALRVAVYEMKYLEGIPAKVSAAEAVAIVKKYADEKEGKFVNGVLGEYIKNELSDQKEN